MAFSNTVSSVGSLAGVRRGRAFSLIELLVVLGVVGILIGLMLPAVQAARESARRVQCSANLMQLRIAMNANYALHGMFLSSQILTRPNWTAKGTICSGSP